jgi:hypothetical protein
MQVKTALMRDVRLTAARGLAAKEEILGRVLRGDIFTAVIVGDLAGVDLKPGEETPVGATVDLPPNANVASITATLTVSAAARAAPETTSVTVTTGSNAGASQTFGVSVDPSPLPRNVQVRLDQGEVIWTHSGTLAAGTYTLPDFAPQANAYLDKAKLPEGQTTLRFMVKSDTPGRVTIAVDANSVTYTLLQTETWSNPLDGSLRIDRNLDLDFGAVERIPLDDLVKAPAAVALDQVTLDLTGTMGPERMLGGLAAHDGRQFATVSSDYFVAQAVRLSSEPGDGLGFKPGSTVRLAGVTGVVEVDDETELYVEVQADAGGAPAADAPLAKLNAKLAPPEPGAPKRWAYVAFETPAEVAVDRDFWVVLKGIRGRARLGLAPAGQGYLGAVLVNRGGQLWRPFERAPATDTAARLAGLVRLVYLPEPDTQSAAVELTLDGSGQPQPADPETTAQRITLAASAGAAPAVLVLSSHARGAVTVANVVQEFAQAQGPRR